MRQRHLPAFAANLTADGFDAGSIAVVLHGHDWLQGTRLDVSRPVGQRRKRKKRSSARCKGKASLALDKGAIAGPGLVALLGQASQRIVDGWTPRHAVTQRFHHTRSRLQGGRRHRHHRHLQARQPGRSPSPRPATLTCCAGRWICAPIRSSSPRTAAVRACRSRSVIKGPWEAPRIYPDVEGLLLNPQKGFETLKSMGPVTSGN